MPENPLVHPSPVTSSGHAVDDTIPKGKTLRDEFAGQALVGLLAGMKVPWPSVSADDRAYLSAVADHAYSIADALLARRSQ